MDLVSSCKEKLGSFRVKDLREVLTHLGETKQGRKQDLLDKIVAILSGEQVANMQVPGKKNSIGREGVAKIIDDIYRKMQKFGATELASKQSDSDVDIAKPKEEVDDSFQSNMKVRCLCGSTLTTDTMIQCEDPRCRVWQHMACVVIPENSTDGVPPLPSQFYCELCRIKHADPFLQTVKPLLHPVKLYPSDIPADGANPPQSSVEKTFSLSAADREMMQGTEYDVQVWCILLNDKVLFRMQWPQFPDLQINGIAVRTINRPGSQLLGVNGRDDGPIITSCTRIGINKISFTRSDARTFCVGVKIVKRRTVQQVLRLIPSELDGERFEDALTRVCRCIGGGNAAGDADSDSDLEVVAESITVNLRCPMSGSRIKTAGRFKPCAHMACFDLETFVELNQRSRKWQCPICLKNYSLEHIIIDPYFNRITTMMRGCGEDVTDVDVKPDGSWRAKNESECWDLAQWHSPDGSLSVSTGRDVKPDPDTSKEIKQEGVSGGRTCLKLRIKTRNRTWEVKRPEDNHVLASEKLLGENNHGHQNVIPMSSSATGSCRDGEDRSVNQDTAGHYDNVPRNFSEPDSFPLNLDSAYGVVNKGPSAPSGNTDVIILSDSEDENENPTLRQAVYETGQTNACGTSFTVPSSGVPVSYPEDPSLVTGSGSCTGLLNGYGDEFGMPLWPLPCSTQAGPGLQLFGSETDVSESLVNVHHTPTTCPTSTNGDYSFAPDMTIGYTTESQTSVCPTTNMNGGLVGSPLAFGEDDPSLQIFLPTCPATSSANADTGNQPLMTTGLREEDWISLRVGDGVGTVGHGQSAAASGLDTRNQCLSKEASLLVSMNDEGFDRTTTDQQKSSSPFSFPRQPRSVQSRSVRPRLYLSIDSDSD